jgi:hypothetical protein
VSFRATELGFDGRNMQVIRVASNPEWGDVINVITPNGAVQVYVSPKGRRTRIFFKNEELTK